MKENKIFEVNSLESVEEVKVLGKCCICGKVITEEDGFREVYFSETQSYKYICEECEKADGGKGYSCCTECEGWFCVRPNSEFVEVWDLNEYNWREAEKTYVCKSIIEDSGCYEKCEKCGTYCITSLLEESGLCPDCEAEAAEEEVE